MIKPFLILVFLFIYGASDISIADQPQREERKSRQNELSGTVILPATQDVKRSFRGRAYRNRGQSVNDETEAKSSNTITDTIVSLHRIDNTLMAEPLAQPVTIHQKGAAFSPKVTPVTVGTTVQFVNDDPFYHNVFSLTPGARFNIGRRPTGDIYKKKIPATTWKVEGLGEIKLFCDIHAQMSAVILSLDTPYYVRVNDDASYTLKNIPDGVYEVRTYNPRFELDSQEIELQNGQQKTLTINFRN